MEPRLLRRLASLLLSGLLVSLLATAGAMPVLAAVAPSAVAGTLSGPGEDDFIADDPFAEDLYNGELDDAILADPLEPVNRALFWFNDKSYFYLIKPVARGFRLVPEPLRSGVDRMFDNLKAPLRAVSCLLQWRWRQTGVELTRLLVNSTCGLAGFYDPALNWWDLRKQDEDFGQVLGHYGVSGGCYLVLPLLGPSTLRDGLALLPQSYADPLYWMLHRDGLLGCRAGALVNSLSLDADTYESLVREQIDPYLFLRDAYLQRRAAQVRD
ncbi:MlaA family lipoprotein [Desulfuromonas thiophila]|uniref:Phospholipid-binding lipoprotein MlaA n=1 Tax=Desulfuromonas thiophila TaxID=57664 RepID=A0A1G6ZYI3_9BACT|nr:VacJ family lipoprotein [Desulfuromonas thiophila]SDE07632.1 phospholipid-binding lipoprotein MlaA [Desulfuromonas thiophila]